MTTDPPFDPTAPLAGPPEPWESAPTPSLRSGPPYHMTDMIAAEPALAGRILDRLAGPGGPAATLAAAVRATVEAGDPVIVTGCGTSEHGALAVAAILREAARRRRPGEHLDLGGAGLRVSLDAAGPRSGHRHHPRGRDGRHERGARGGAIGRREHGRRHRQPPLTGGRAGPIVVETEELDHGWCHTVGYLSPILAGAAVGAHLSGRPLDADDRRRGCWPTAPATRPGPTAIAAALADVAQLLVVASGSDRPAGRELVLKVEEASWLPSAYRDLETFLHGHLPATGPTTGLVLVLTDRDRRDERLARARQALAAARVIGLRAAAIVAADLDGALDPGLTPAGRLLVSEAPTLPAPVAALSAPPRRSSS